MHMHIHKPYLKYEASHPFHPGLQTAAAGKIALGMQETKGVQPAIRGFWAQLKRTETWWRTVVLEGSLNYD